jgi:hypothetical protein
MYTGDLTFGEIRVSPLFAPVGVNGDIEVIVLVDSGSWRI